MKKLYIVSLVFSFLFILSCEDSEYFPITFTKTFGGRGVDIGSSVQQTTDGGYIISGRTSSIGNLNPDVYLIKTDTNGEEEWTKTFGGSDHDDGSSVQQTTDGGYILLGFTMSFGNGGSDAYLVKTDSNGDSLWTKTFGGSDYDYGSSVQQTTDGGYILLGHTTSFGNGSSDAYLVKTDSNGDSLWTKTFGGSGSETASTIQQTTDGGYILTGYTTSFGNGGSDAYLVKTDSNGEEEWTKTFGGSATEAANSIQQTTDGGYILTGYTGSIDNGGLDAYLVKTDSNGDSLWTKTFGGSALEIARSIQQTTDGGYILTGYTTSFGNGREDAFLIKTDTNGEEEWTKTFGGSATEAANSIQQTTDGGYILSGYTYSFGNGNSDVYLVKTDSDGNIILESELE